MPGTEQLDHVDVAVGVSRPIEQDSFASSAALPAWLVNSRLLGVVVLDDGLSIVFANDQFARFFGLQSAELLIGANLSEACELEAGDPQCWRQEGECSIRARDKAGTAVLMQVEVSRIRRSDGASLYRCVASLQSEPPETGQLLEHAARMEAVAGLSSGIAHDFNNLLTVLVGNLYLLAEELRDNESAFTRIKAARDTALRGADLTRQLLNYARDDGADEAEVRPASVVRRLQSLLDKLVGSRIKLQVELSAEDASVTAGRAQLESAIVNLVINARDAIDGDGTVTISVDEAAGREFGESDVIVRVADTGPGMSEDVRRRVFEPFFTTKSAGRGTGLGLSMVRWFAERAGGSVDIDSRPGHGTSVSVILPRTSVSSGDTTCSRTLPLSVLPNGDEKVLLVIEDAEVRAMTQQTLAVLGYDVLIMSRDELTAVRDEDIAVAVVDAQGCPDIVELTQAVRDNTPHTKVLVLTPGRIRELDSRMQLRKPFSLAELAGSVRQTLDGESVGD